MDDLELRRRAYDRERSMMLFDVLAQKDCCWTLWRFARAGRCPTCDFKHEPNTVTHALRIFWDSAPLLLLCNECHDPMRWVVCETWDGRTYLVRES